MNQGREDPNVSPGESLVRYRLLAPDLWTPPRSHKRVDEGEYLGPYESNLDLLDELDAIDVIDWGGA